MAAFRAILAASVVLAFTAGPAAAHDVAPAPKFCSEDNNDRYCSTTIHFVVQNCELCVVTAESKTLDRKSKQDLTWDSSPVHNSRTSLVVATAVTDTMIFEIRRPSRNDISAGDAGAVVVLGYRDLAPGSRVSAAQSAGERSASDCWAGTGRGDQETTIEISHRSYRLPQGSPWDHVDAFWASPTHPVVPGTWEDSSDGGLGTQDPGSSVATCAAGTEA